MTWAVDILVNTLPSGAVGQPPTHVFTYDSLNQWNSKLIEEPGLAESWEAIDDQTYVFNLRQGVLFHDGKEMTVDDVIYSYNTHREPPPPGQAFSFYPKIESLEALDPYTLQINLTQPDPSLIGFTTWTRYSNIMPVDMIEEINSLAEAIGTGAYRLTDFASDSYATLVKNEDYWDPNVGFIDEIELAFLPDEPARLAALRSGNIDGATFSADTVHVARRRRRAPVLSGLQANHREIQVTTKGDPKPWHDIRVRQAVTHAINRQDIIDKVYGGEAEVAGVIPTGYGEWPIPVDQLRDNFLKFDLELARQLMEEAGYADGFSVELQSIATPRDFTQAAEVVREHLREINIDVTVQPLEFGTFAENNGAGDYEWQLTGRGFRGDPSGYRERVQSRLGHLPELVRRELGEPRADPAPQRRPLHRRYRRAQGDLHPRPGDPAGGSGAHHPGAADGLSHRQRPPEEHGRLLLGRLRLHPQNRLGRRLAVTQRTHAKPGRDPRRAPFTFPVIDKTCHPEERKSPAAASATPRPPRHHPTTIRPTPTHTPHPPE